MVKKPDGRRVYAATQAQLRRAAVKAVRAGMTQTAAAVTFGVSVRKVDKWIALANRGKLVFRLFHGTFRAPMFVDFMRRLRLQCAGKVYFIVDGHPVQRAKIAKVFVAANAADLRWIQLPSYCPELNPDELLNQEVRINALGKRRPRNRDEMMDTVRRHLFCRQKQPQLIQNLFQEQHVKYAA